MSSQFWEILLLLAAVAFAASGLAYCHHDRQTSYRECLKFYSPLLCKEGNP